MIPLSRKRPEPLSRWIESVVRLPVGLSTEPGPIKLAPYMREIADAISDPRVERVTCLKSARIDQDANRTRRSQNLSRRIARDVGPAVLHADVDGAQTCRQARMVRAQGPAKSCRTEREATRGNAPNPHQTFHAACQMRRRPLRVVDKT